MLPDAQQVAVAQAPAPGDALAVDEGAVAREPVVDHEPLAAQRPQLRVELGDLGIPTDPHVGSLAAADRHRVRARQRFEHELVLLIAVGEERMALALGGELALELARRGVLCRGAALHGLMVASSRI